ncbi:hypothetical protein R1sor_024765 [Riccia sorocarpa]|uniref:Protein kinase domain-containing protein n=1 Tax=Riccia sorocarpa TaxID=122646 RepID=A0ABD3GTV5_9MARC
MVPRTRLGAGLYGTVYKVGVLDSSLVADLGSHDMVFYVAKILNDTPWSNARDEMLKELFAFTVNHPTVVRPVAPFSDPKTPGLLFPWWNGTAVKKWNEIERKLRGKVTLDGQTRQVSEDIGKYDRDHELNATIFRRHRLQIARTLLQGLAFMHGQEKLEYDRDKWAMGYPTTNEPPHQTHRLRLKEALDAMVYLNISSLRDHRKTAEYWAHYFIDQLMVDHTICMRPIESTKRAAKHPDGPRDIKENKW